MNKCHVQPLPEMPSLFRMPPDVASTNAGGDGFDLFEPPSVASGGGLMHVDDLLATAHVDTLKDMVEVLSSKYKINAQWVCQVGDSLTFLKRRHKLISETELEIHVPGRHIEKLMEVCGGLMENPEASCWLPEPARTSHACDRDACSRMWDQGSKAIAPP